jgi:hypothetical protein
MAQGDAQRQWFQEMKIALKERFALDLSWADLILLAEQLDTTLQQIRSDRNILPAMMTCTKCGIRARAKAGRISVNAVILAVSRFGLAPEADMKELSRRWKKYQKGLDLDLYGRRKESINHGAPKSTCHLPTTSGK